MTPNNQSKAEKEGRKETDHKGPRTREMILAAAREVFSRHPYDAASIRMIAAQGGFYHGLIRYHFPSKAAIFETVAGQVCEDLKNGNRAWLNEVVGLEPGEALSCYLDRFIDHYRSHPETFKIIGQNLSGGGPENVPGYRHLLDLLRGSRADFEEILAGLFDLDSSARFLESFNALIIHYLGSGDSEARLLGMEPDSGEYLGWVKKTMVFVFLPVLENAFRPEG